MEDGAGDDRDLGLRPSHVPSTQQPLDVFGPVIGPESMAALTARAEEVAALLEGRTFWNVNSTATGGGVAEMLGPLVAYGRGAGLDVRWMVIAGNGEFFDVTKRLHNKLHGAAGDGGSLGAAEHRLYEQVLGSNLPDLLDIVRPGDIVLLHDPQTAGLVGPLRRAGVHVVWRCHIGTDTTNEHVAEGWAFLQEHVEAAEMCVFTRESYVPDFLDPEDVRLIPPSLDPFSPKNRELDAHQVRGIVRQLGVVAGNGSEPAGYTLRDGTPRRVDRSADIVRAGPVPGADVPLVAQVSRWDRLKDPVGVMQGFADHAISRTDAHLALVGPSVAGVSDDPEGAAVFRECLEQWQLLPSAARQRIQLVTLPMRDVDENAAMVNALQRHAAVVVQKSIQEGFGLTVAEAMWKSRPVIGGAVGGIVDQVVDGETGVLVDPTDREQFGRAVVELVNDPERAQQMGRRGHERCVEHYIGPRHLLQYADVIVDLVTSE